VRNLNIKDSSQNKANIPERVFPEIKHGKSSNDEMNRIPHSLKVCFPEQRRHGRSGYGSSLPGKEGMIAAFITATVVAAMLIVMMQETGFPADWARRVTPLTSFPLCPRAFGCKLVIARPALILLIPIRISAVTIEMKIVVALWTGKLVYFCHENISPFWEVHVFVVKTLYQKG
jgi:hypothetical protein